MSLTPEELRKYAQNFDQPYRALNPVKCLELADELERLQTELADWKRNGHIYLWEICDRQKRELSTYKEALDLHERNAEHNSKLYTGAIEAVSLLQKAQSDLLGKYKIAKEALEVAEKMLSMFMVTTDASKVTGLNSALTQVRKVLGKE